MLLRNCRLVHVNRPILLLYVLCDVFVLYIFTFYILSTKPIGGIMHVCTALLMMGIISLQNK